MATLHKPPRARTSCWSKRRVSQPKMEMIPHFLTHSDGMTHGPQESETNTPKNLSIDSSAANKINDIYIAYQINKITF
jgi:hypothetical protein